MNYNSISYGPLRSIQILILGLNYSLVRVCNARANDVAEGKWLTNGLAEKWRRKHHSSVNKRILSSLVCQHSAACNGSHYFFTALWKVQQCAPGSSSLFLFGRHDFGILFSEQSSRTIPQHPTHRQSVRSDTHFQKRSICRRVLFFFPNIIFFFSILLQSGPSWGEKVQHT